MNVPMKSVYTAYPLDGASEQTVAATSRTNRANTLDRRTMIVWAALLGSMTIVSGLLLALEPSTSVATPGPVAADVSPLRSGDMLATTAPLATDRWQAVVVHHSGEASGNADTLDKAHRAAGFAGLGYHFVIGNGNGLGDGEVQAGPRWNAQQPGPHVVGGDNADWFNHYAVSICLIGDGDTRKPTDRQMEKLAELVNELQRRLDIGADRVLLNYQVAPTAGPGVLFPAGSFRQQLLNR